MNAAAYYASPEPEELYVSFVRNGGSETVKAVSRNFKIKVYGAGVNKLVGVFGLIELLGVDLAVRLIGNAYTCGKDVYTINLRRGIKVSFYSV